MKKEVIVVSAVWCPSCLILKKYLKKIEEKNNLSFKLLDYDFDEDEVKKYDIGDKLPVMICNDNRLIGEHTYEEIIEFLKDNDVL